MCLLSLGVALSARWEWRNCSESTALKECSMATDYDAPRKTDEELTEDSLEELKQRHAEAAQAAAVDVDEAELAEVMELPGADLSDQTLSVLVVPKQEGEFTCSRCYLVHQRSALSREVNGQLYCRDCDL